MPLRCLRGCGDEMLAFRFEPDQWEALKDSYKGMGLRMPCCGAAAIPKTSPLGTFFFAHGRKGGCESSTETKEHLLAKTVVAKAIDAAGWRVTTEYRGSNPDGSVWIADVFAEKGRSKIAFEIQWSSQDAEETRRRQDRYANSGVWAIWLFRQKGFPTGAHLPAFHLEHNQDFRVRLPEPGAHYPRNDAQGWIQSIPLQAFVGGVLDGNLVWQPIYGKRSRVRVEGWKRRCRKCGEMTQTVQWLTFEFGKELPGYPPISHDIYQFGDCLDLLHTIFPQNIRDLHHIGPLQKSSSRRTGDTYLGNHCYSCGAFLDRYFEDYYNSHRGVFFYDHISAITEVDVVVTFNLVKKLRWDKKDVDCWYFEK